jgi:hypothetical protein
MKTWHVIVISILFFVFGTSLISVKGLSEHSQLLREAGIMTLGLAILNELYEMRKP